MFIHIKRFGLRWSYTQKWILLYLDIKVKEFLGIVACKIRIIKIIWLIGPLPWFPKQWSSNSEIV